MKKILIVEDEEGICCFMKELFERKGCEVFVSTDTKEGLEIFRRERPQACLLDVHMPYSEFDGLELLKRIREIDKDISCAILSRVDQKQKIEEAKKLGVERYIFKPSSPEEVRQLVDELSC